MKNLLTILLFLPLLSSAQTIDFPVTTEYRCLYKCSDGNIRAFNAGSAHVVSFPLPGSRTVLPGQRTAAGGFNSILSVANDSTCWININDATTTWYQNNSLANANFATDSSGATFNGVATVDAMSTNYLAVKGDGSLWYFGQDSLHLVHSSGGVTIRPIKISGSLHIKKALFGLFRIVALTTAGDVYEWVRNSGSIVPVQKTIPRPAIDIWTSHYDYAGCLIPNATGSQTMGYPYVWGSQNGAWQGNSSYTQPTNITSQWGLSSSVPLQSVCANWNTTHVIDSLGRMWANAYCQTNGELGNGVEFANQYGYSQPYSWTLTDGENPSGGTMVQIGAGTTWTAMYSNTFFTFYKYAKDNAGNFYSWGVDKAMVLGDGQLCLQEATYRNNNDKTVPTLTTPLTATYRTLNFTLPAISAGSTQTITTSSTTLTASGHPALLINSANSTDTANYSIASYQWVQTSGAACTITSPTAKSTDVTALTTGTYVFDLVTTDNNGGTAHATVTVNATVSGGCNCSYYFASSGSDANAGDIGHPFQTFAKLNSLSSDVTASFYLNGGDAFTGAITNFKGKRLDSYGTGQAIVNGFTSLSSWTNEGGGIYSASCSGCNSNTNLVTINGVQQQQARWPNTGYRTISTVSGTASFTDALLTGTPNWTGAQAVIRNNHYTVSTNPITNHSGTTITYTAATSQVPGVGYGYFILNHPSALDTMGEWIYTSGLIKVFFGANNPASYTVKATSVDTLLKLGNGLNGTVVNNIDFEGAGVISVFIGQDTNTVISNCAINFSGGEGILDSIGVATAIFKTSINQSNDNGIVLQPVTKSARIDTNTVRNAGMMLGQAKNIQGGNYCGIRNQAINGVARYNRVDSTGYDGIAGYQDTAITNNWVSHSTMLLDDGAGIYHLGYKADTTVRNIIRNNIVTDCPGNVQGTADGFNQSFGIYSDNNNVNEIIDSNTITRIGYSGIFLHNNRRIGVYDNTIYDCATGIDQQGDNYPQYPINNITIKRNIIGSTGSGKFMLNFSAFSGASYYGNLNVDSNYYSYPPSYTTPFRTYNGSVQTLSTYSQWQGIVSDTHARLYNNAQFFAYSAPSTVVAVGDNYIDVAGALYTRSFPLSAYSSKILFYCNCAIGRGNQPKLH